MKQLTARSLFKLNRIAFQGGRCCVNGAKTLAGEYSPDSRWCRDMARSGYLQRVEWGKYVLTEKARMAVEAMRKEAFIWA